MRATRASRNAEADPFAGWDSVPLFMKSLPDPDDADASNPTLEALQSLMYEGDPAGEISSSSCAPA